MRASGILLPIFSLPSAYGIGDFSSSALRFIDLLSLAGQRYWQILPLGPAGGWNSPYQPLSCFAGDPVYISPEILIRKRLIEQEEVDRLWAEAASGMIEDRVNYDRLLPFRLAVLQRAFSNFTESEDYLTFLSDNERWLPDYALFTSLRDYFCHRPLSGWPKDIRERKPDALSFYRAKLSEEIRFVLWQQFEFYSEWQTVLRYAHARGIAIIGDIPIYASYDSADCWVHPEVFKIRKDLSLAAVAGCPPDAFAPEGQRWGNPLYNWRELKRTEYAWWIERLRQNFRLYDVIRLDHTRGLESYYQIPASEETAMNGKWMKGPGMDFFRAVREALPYARFIAEDLGFITPAVKRMIQKSGLPGMKVLQFAFDGDPDNPYLPENYRESCVVYTGTHDNNTTRGWYHALPEESRREITQYLRQSKSPGIALTRDSGRAPMFGSHAATGLLVTLALSSRAELAIIPLQDYLAFGEEARINVPGTVGGNWEWRLCPGVFTEDIARSIRVLAESTGR